MAELAVATDEMAEAGVPREAWNVRELATALGVPEKQVRALVKTGLLGHVRIGRHIRVPDSELHRYLDENLQRGAA